MRNDWGFSELVARTTATPTYANVAVAFAPKARRGGYAFYVGLIVVAFALYCLTRF